MLLSSLAQLLKDFLRFIFSTLRSVKPAQHSEWNRILGDGNRLLIFRDRFRNGTFQLQGQPQRVAGILEYTVHLHRLSQLRDGLIETPQMNVGESKIAVDDERKWVELDCAFHFGEFALVLTNVCQRIIGEPLMRGRVVRIQLQSSLVLADCAGIIESIETLERGQSSMSTGRRVIQCESFLRRSVGLGKTIFRCASVESRE